MRSLCTPAREWPLLSETRETHEQQQRPSAAKICKYNLKRYLNRKHILASVTTLTLFKGHLMTQPHFASWSQEDISHDVVASIGGVAP